MSDVLCRGDVGLTPERWRRIDRLLNDALERPPHERSAFLAQECAGEQELREQIEGLLAAATRTEGPVERFVDVLDATPSVVDSSLVGDAATIGPYRVVREIGRGGMGIVYLAQRADGHYDRAVALKLMRNPLRGESHAQRFIAERQILARLAHPGIAQLFDGGVTTEGLPYFTMEYVNGLAIDGHSDTHSLDIRARVRLFTRVCEAVAAAHRALVVHRDLKPGNVLITPAGEVKLLDFGIAKLLDPEAQPDLTRTGAMLFTPEYASPEQVRGLPITTATDIYSLGVMLFRLLTGEMPHRFVSRTAADIERTICNDTPPLASDAIADRLAADREAAVQAARARGTTPERLRRQLAGDLDVIVAKALHKDQSRRYASVDHLRHDLESFLAGRPVLARPDDWRYRARKFVSRHRAAAAAGLLVALSLAGGLVATTWQARQARLKSEQAAMERDRAMAEAARVRKVSGLLTELFKMADPREAQGSPVSAREVLERGTRRIESELAGEPQTQAMFFDSIGQVYRNLALYGASAQVLERAVELRRTIAGDSLELAESLHHLAQVKHDVNKFADAETLLREALEIRIRNGATAGDLAATQLALGETLSELGQYEQAEVMLRRALDALRTDHARPERMVQAAHELGLVLHRRGDFAQAEQLFRESVERGRALGATMTPEHAAALVDLARLVHRFDRRPRDAEPLFVEALRVLRTLYVGDHPAVAECLSEYSRALADMGRVREAEALARESYATYRRLFGAGHRDVVIITQSLAGFLRLQGKRAEAERLYRDAVAGARAGLGDTNPLSWSAMSALASFLEEDRRWAEALALRRQAVDAARARFGEAHAIVARDTAALGRHYMLRGRFADAELEYQKAIAIRERLHTPGHWRIAEARSDLGEVLVKRGRYADAESLLRSAYDTLRINKEAPPEQVRRARARVVELYNAWGRAGAAASYR